MTTIPPACQRLFEYALEGLTDDIIVDESFGDPGYKSYVATYMRLKATRRIPSGNWEEIWNLRENYLGNSCWTKRSPSFHRFRWLTGTAILPLMPSNEIDIDVLAANVCVVNLIRDALILDEDAALPLVRDALREHHYAVATHRWYERAFVTLGELIVGSMVGSSEEGLTALADRLFIEEQDATDRHDEVFLFGTTSHNKLQRVWQKLVRDHVQPLSPSLEVLRAMILPVR